MVETIVPPVAAPVALAELRTFLRIEGVDSVAVHTIARCREEGVSRAILFNLSGHGHFDMQAYTDYFAGKLANQAYDESELATALAGLPDIGRK